MLQIRVVQLVFFFLFVAVTKADAIPVFSANLTNFQDRPFITASVGGFTPASFDITSSVFNDTVNTPFGWGVGGTSTGKWKATEGNSMPLVAELPEPAGVILLGIGILIVGFFCRRGLRKR